MPHTHDSEILELRIGPLTARLESLFWHLQRYPRRRVSAERGWAKPPMSEAAHPRELEDPWRQGQGRVIRIPGLRRGIVLGWWEPAGDTVLEEEESDRLLQAVAGEMVEGVTATEISEWDRPTTPLSTRVLIWFAELLERFNDRFTMPTRPAREQEAVAERGWSLIDDGQVIDVDIWKTS